MNIALVVFDRITPLDVVGPYEVLSRVPGAQVTMVGPSRGLVRSDNRALGLMADKAFDEVTACDLLLVPGGFGTRALVEDGHFLDWLRATDQTTRITASVCTGTLLLAAAGLLENRRATTHWAFRDRLAHGGTRVSPDRIVRDGKYASAAGVSAGIDLALALVVEMVDTETAARIQLAIEYDPAPPLDAGNPERAPVARREHILASLRAREAAGVGQA